MRKYSYTNSFELGRITFTLGLTEINSNYKTLSAEDRATFIQGWDFEYKCNLVRTLKIYENKEVPHTLKWYDRVCINRRFVDRKAFNNALFG